MKNKEILCTLGPSSMNERVIVRLEGLGVNLFRINLSHTKLENVAAAISLIRRYSTVPICLDSEGAQIRTGAFAEGEVDVEEDGLIRLHKQTVPGDAENINFYPDDAAERLIVGDLISIDFNSVLAQVIALDASGAQLRVLNGGKVGSNKAVTVHRDIDLPVMTAKDKAALKIGREMGIKHVALSFANRPSDIDEMRALCGKDVFLISKIECRQALANLKGITKKSDAILIDRGDLSRQEPLERIPLLQKAIIREAMKLKKKVYVATNLLESMVTASKPTRAEVNDVINTLIDGADGLVLAAETAIGRDPIGCAGMIVKLIHEYESSFRLGSPFTAPTAKSLLVEAHGGQLVEREAVLTDAALSKLKKIAVTDSDLMDCEQIALGTYSPLTGFMDIKTVTSVLETCRLPAGLIWTMPILLRVDKAKAGRVHAGERVLLTDQKGEGYALMDVTEIAPFDPEPFFKKWFATDSRQHPGVADALARGEFLMAGDITLLRRLPSKDREYPLTPAQSRFIFAHKGWNRVVGFDARTVIHPALETVQKRILELTHADGIYISPASVPRFCGPREAVFTALCRKNMGCSHFIVGSDRPATGDTYSADDHRKLFERLGDIGIVPVFFDAVSCDVGLIGAGTVV